MFAGSQTPNFVLQTHNGWGIWPGKVFARSKLHLPKKHILFLSFHSLEVITDHWMDLHAYLFCCSKLKKNEGISLFQHSAFNFFLLPRQKWNKAKWNEMKMGKINKDEVILIVWPAQKQKLKMPINHYGWEKITIYLFITNADKAQWGEFKRNRTRDCLSQTQ